VQVLRLHREHRDRQGDRAEFDIGLGAHKLLRSSRNYLRGDRRGPGLQRCTAAAAAARPSETPPPSTLWQALLPACSTDSAQATAGLATAPVRVASSKSKSSMAGSQGSGGCQRSAALARDGADYREGATAGVSEEGGAQGAPVLAQAT